MPIEVRTDKLDQLLITIEKTLSSSGIASALGQAGDIGLAEARNLVPVLSGTLRDSIYADVVSSDTLAIGAKAPYAAFIELGTSKQNAKPFIEPAAHKAAAVLEQILTEIMTGVKGVGRPTTTGAGTYEPTGNKVGRPTSTKKPLFKEHKESDRKTQRKYISKRKSPGTGKWIYEYGDQPRLRTARTRTTDRRNRRTGSANRGQ